MHCTKCYREISGDVVRAGDDQLCCACAGILLNELGEKYLAAVHCSSRLVALIVAIANAGDDGDTQPGVTLSAEDL